MDGNEVGLGRRTIVMAAGQALRCLECTAFCFCHARTKGDRYHDHIQRGISVYLHGN